ncbi:hypothetical protein FGG08_005413 [Glutinoglossum americanum]|uniref:SET domain-containing protein n=1 Tax=Glutinoglossum americanum TaxID=1670608 RepID=A0A9P8L1G1_9PEZI|nr:hypothetical protein FGG08_005413 [Glutinoglossum americanum]
MRQSQTNGRNVVDLTLDSDSDDVGTRIPQAMKGRDTTGKMANVNSRRPNVISLLDASENRLTAQTVGFNEKVGQRISALTNGSVPATMSSQRVTLDRWLTADTASFKTPTAPIDIATAMELAHSQDSDTARSSGRKRKLNTKYTNGDWDGLSPAIKVTPGFQNGDTAGLERGPQSSNEISAKRAPGLQSAQVLAQRQGSPTPMRLSMQTPMRISTGGRLKSRPTGEPGYLTGFGSSLDTPRTATKLLSPIEMTTLLRKYLAEIAEDHDYFVTGMLRDDNMRPAKFATSCGRFYCGPTEHFEAESPIKGMKAIQFPSMPKGLYDASKYGKLSATIWKSHNSKPVESRMIASLTKHSATTEFVPKYSSYTSLRRNVLAEDDDKLRYFPYFGDDINDGGALQELYSDWTKNLPTVHQRSEQAAMFAGIAEKFLAETGLSFYDAVHYLIGNIETIAPQASSVEELEQAKRERKKAALYHDFELEPAKQKGYLDSIPPLTLAGLAMAPAVCKAWKDATTISLWDVIKGRDVGVNPGKQSQNAPAALHQRAANGYYSIGTVYSMKCLICFAHECPAHHHVFEYLGLDAKSNFIHPLIDNSTSPFRSDEACSNLCFLKGEVSLDPASKPWSSDQLALFQSSFDVWKDFERAGCLMALMIDRPCAEIHMKISEQKASSVDALSATKPELSSVDSRIQPLPKEAVVGEKRKRPSRLLDRDDIGSTSLHSERTNFRPCSHVGPCAKDYLCGTCGAIEILDPVNRYDDEICLRKCTNVALQRDRPKRTLIGASRLAGYGLFMGEPAKAGEFLGEYKGELISNDEAERRGVVYDVRGFSYLFNVNEDHVIDANRAGNKFRFVNHSRLGENCAPRVVFANGVHRIGMYARRDLVVGEELYFNYNYGGKSLKFVQKEIDAPLVPPIVKPRSHKAGGGTSQSKANKKNGKKGGPRPGAGRKPSNDNSHTEGEGNGAGGGNAALDLYEFVDTGAKSDSDVAELEDAYAETSQYDFSERNSEERDNDRLLKGRDHTERKRKRSRKG